VTPPQIKSNQFQKCLKGNQIGHVHKIVKDPIDLPCDEHVICREHLIEKDVVIEDKIKRNDCNKEFQIKDNEFKSNKSFKKLMG
jgi:hypothetical protein